MRKIPDQFQKLYYKNDEYLVMSASGLGNGEFRMDGFVLEGTNVKIGIVRKVFKIEDVFVFDMEINEANRANLMEFYKQCLEQEASAHQPF